MTMTVRILDTNSLCHRADESVAVESLRLEAGRHPVAFALPAPEAKLLIVAGNVPALLFDEAVLAEEFRYALSLMAGDRAFEQRWKEELRSTLHLAASFQFPSSVTDGTILRLFTGVPPPNPQRRPVRQRRLRRRPRHRDRLPHPCRVARPPAASTPRLDVVRPLTLGRSHDRRCLP